MKIVSYNIYLGVNFPKIAGQITFSMPTYFVNLV